jgi:hypothetical protein
MVADAGSEIWDQRSAINDQHQKKSPSGDGVRLFWKSWHHAQCGALLAS